MFSPWCLLLSENPESITWALFAPLLILSYTSPLPRGQCLSSNLRPGPAPVWSFTVTQKFFALSPPRLHLPVGGNQALVSSSSLRNKPSLAPLFLSSYPFSSFESQTSPRISDKLHCYFLLSHSLLPIWLLSSALHWPGFCQGPQWYPWP